MQKANLGDVIVVDDVRTTVIYDAYGQPILVVSVVEDGTLLASSAKDSDFRSVLSSLGIGLNATVKVLT
jgi:hypothetical protein